MLFRSPTSTGRPAEKQEKKDALMEDFSLKSERVHTVNQLLKAYAMFEKDVDYVVLEENGGKKVKIVDESTGRIMEGRRWSDGLHQAVEAKENVKVEAATVPSAATASTGSSRHRWPFARWPTP